jgi:hypothetical protein
MKELAMKRLIATFLVLSGSMGVACYRDDALLHAPAISPTKVFLTDDPFPYDTVQSVSIFVTKIEGSTGRDTTGTGTWATIATPNKSFDLLTLQQGDTAFVGQGVIEAGRYVSIRMTINIDQSSIKYRDGTNAVVQWQFPGYGPIVLYAVVETPLSVSATGTTIVIDFDVGRTFVYNFVAHNFLMSPGTLRAVNSAITGAIAGHVTQLDSNGISHSIANSDVSVFYSGSTGLPFATGRTDASGAYKVGFLGAGSYLVLIQHPKFSWLSSVAAPNVNVTAGGTSTLDVVLPPFSTGSSFVSITGRDSLSYPYDEVLLHAAVVDSHGVPQPYPNVTWISRDTTIVRLQPDTPAVADSLSNVFVTPWGVGTAWVVATSGTLADSIQMRVIPSQPPPPPPAGVASVTLSPASLNIAVNDSVYFVATLKDSSGNVVSNGTVFWSILPGQDSTVVDVFSYGLQALIRGKRAGNTILRATEPISGAHADGQITVH